MLDELTPYFPAAAGVLLALAFYSFAVAPYDLEVTESNFTLFDGSGEPVKVVFISDTEHAYDHPEYLSRVVSMINAQEPDIVLLGGDYAESEERGWEKLGLLGSIRAEHGVYAVLGNHDYQQWGCSRANLAYADETAKKLESMGITVLRNGHRVVEARGRRLAIVGLDDVWACRSDFVKAEAGVPPVPQLVLAHNPAAVYGEALPAGAVVLSGHTHCGQVRLPLVSETMLAFIGLDAPIGGRGKVGTNDIYVTCGITPGGVRFLTRPEISVLYIY
jgi:predicted MPP superfamily phosphohydrolase